jgi:hypothetical protein
MDDLNHIEPDLRPLAVPIDELRPDPHQARVHDGRSIDEIERSLREHGQKKPIVVERATGVVKAGNGTLEAARRLGWTHLAAVRSDDVEAALRLYALRDNRTGEFAQWIGEKVIAELAGLEVEPERAGWTDEELAAIALSSQNDEEFGIIEIPPNGKSKAKIAMDSLSLGNHESWNVNVVIGEIRTVLHQNDYQRLFVWLESNYTRTGKSYANLLAELIRRAAT